MEIIRISAGLVPVRCLVLALSLLLSFSAQAQTQLKDNIVVHYSKVARDKMALDVRPVDAAPFDKVSAHLGDIELPISVTAAYPSEQQSTAILFLVDTSDPRRQDAIDINIQHIDQLLEFQQPHYRYALARFDTDLEFLTRFGVSADTIRQQARTLTAEGKTTELFRNTLGAIKQLTRYPAERKFLFLLSDGRAEDRAYFHRDVVKAAIKSNISLFTIGYADTIKLTVELQILRRMSEDTGGQYLSTQPGTYHLDNKQLQNMFAAMNLGAQYAVNLSPALQAGLGGRQQITVSITSNKLLTQINLPVRLPSTPLSRIVQTATVPITAATADAALAPQIIIQRVPSTSTSQAQEMYWLLVALSVLMIVFMIYLAIRFRDGLPSRSHSASEPEETDDAYAWLVNTDEHTSGIMRYPISSAKTKIGRYRGNDIALHDSGISRFHAEIHFTDDGGFVITDMGSKNGLLVNDKETLEQRLNNNDVIEIGDTRLRLEIPEELADDMQATQMFRTQLPPQGSQSQ